MNAELFFQTLKENFKKILIEQNLEEESVDISCRALSPEEAIGQTKRQDFPIISGKDVMIEAVFRGSRGQAFTDAPTTFSGTLKEILSVDLLYDSGGRSLFIAAVNAVMSYLGLCCGSVHCRKDGPEQCAKDMLSFLRTHHSDRRRLALIGYQPAILEKLAGSEFSVRALDLNPENVGSVRYGILVEDGRKAYDSVVNGWADLILCTGSTICNGTIVDYLDLNTEVIFFGTTIAGPAILMNLKRACFAQQYL